MFEHLPSFYSDLHWKRTGFFSKLLLFIMAVLKFVPEALLFGAISALVSFSSTTYSIAGTMDAKFKEVGESGGIPAFSVWFWGPLMIVCGILAFVSALVVVIFKSFLTANQCDVVSRILQKSRLRALATLVVQEGIWRNPQEHTEAFLRIRAIVMNSYKEAALPALYEIEAKAKDFSDRKQMVRVYKQLAEAYTSYGDERSARRTLGYARALGEELDLDDQLLKTYVV
ncbi:MAG: hypothetical protein AMXMBFR44_1340 [Candidatus Campbellbacteria bacterium]